MSSPPLHLNACIFIHYHSLGLGSFVYSYLCSGKNPPKRVAFVGFVSRRKSLVDSRFASRARANALRAYSVSIVFCHVLFWQEFREAIYSWIASQWHVCPELLRVFFRYPPSYAHLVRFLNLLCFSNKRHQHIHIYDLTVSVVHVKDILLDDVIDWLSHDDAYFERASLSVLVSQESPLWEGKSLVCAKSRCR